MSWAVLGALALDTRHATVFEHGWQSWSPTTWYGLKELPHRPASDRNRLICYRPETQPPNNAFWGEGLLAVAESDDGPTHVFGARSPELEVPSIRADVDTGEGSFAELTISADGPVDYLVVREGTGDRALGVWADAFAEKTRMRPPRPAPTIWSPWYHYFREVSAADVVENLHAIEDCDLPIEVIALDDGYQTAVGDWLALVEGFGDLEGLVQLIRDRGRRSGIWMAPFLVAQDSTLAAEHRDWLVSGTDQHPIPVAWNWGQHLFALDTTHPDAMQRLAETISTFRRWGIDFFKMDFLFAGAVDGHRRDQITGVGAYRLGLQLIREAIGPDAYLLASGAPILPSVGLTDAMRVSPDIDPRYAPSDGDLSQPSQLAATLTGRGRAFTHGRWWTNDADCLIARPGVERREEWAAHVARYSGLRGSGDRIRALDKWGLETTRSFLTNPAPPRLVW